jgi:hypothetical protein
MAKLIISFVLPFLLLSGCAVMPPAIITETTASKTAIEHDIQPPIVVTPGTKFEVVYFHAPFRCATCLCWEEQITYVVNTYFAAYLKNGTMTYQVLDLGDYKNNDMARKYGTSSSQFFVNRIVDGKDNIKYIQDLYQWQCLTSKNAFDNAVKEVIQKSLEGRD